MGFIDFSPKISEKSFYGAKYKQLNKYLETKVKVVKDFDVILSDNLFEIYNFNKKTILFANFFWPIIYKKNNKNYFNKFINFMKKNKPFIISNKYFFMKNYLNHFKNIYEIPFFNYNKPKKENFNKKKILISFGTAKDKSLIISGILEILKSNHYSKYEIYIEPRFYKLFKDFENVYEADYSNNMYSRVNIAIIRAGYSTILKCIKNNIYIFYLKSQNMEIKFNSKIIHKYSLGEPFSKKSLFEYSVKNNQKIKINKNFEFNADKSLIDLLKFY